MGFVTVLVQHSWSMQPSGMEESSPQSSRSGSKKSTKRVNKKVPQPTRLSDPDSIQAFVHSYNSAHSLSSRQSKESEARDILERLSKLILQSCIPDSNRLDLIRSKMIKSNDPSKTKDKTRFFSSQSRSSLVVFASIKTRHLKEKAIETLLEALDTNCLSYDANECLHLFQLAKYLKKSLESLIDKAKSKRSLISRIDAEPTLDERVPIDSFMQKILRCLYLTIKRMEYISDSGFLKLTVNQSELLLQIREELPILWTNDPYMIQFISSLNDSVIST